MRRAKHLRSARSPTMFFALAAAMAIPIWVAGDRLGVVVGLRVPASDLILAFVPMLAALALVTWRDGVGAAGDLLRRAVAVWEIRNGWWLAATLLLAPLLYLATYGVMRLAGGDPIAPPDAPRLALLFLLFVILALGEEVGWTGYALDPLQARWGPIGASLIIAAPWWIGHLPSMRAVGATAADIAWWALAAPSLRILFTGLYTATGRCLSAAVLFHAMLNLSRIATYPAAGSHYDSRYQAVGSAVAALAALGVAITLWRRPGRR